MAKRREKNTKISKNSRLKQKFPIVRLCIKANSNNSIVVMTDLEGMVIAWSSAGKVGFKGSKKSTPFAAQKVTEEIIDKARMVDAQTLQLVIDGYGQGRDAFLRAIQASGLQVDEVRDVTGFAHGGPKPVNRRRV